jgi:holo-[acyl-carrier protein] synthase
MTLSPLEVCRPAGQRGMRLGADVARIGAIAESLRLFGHRFARRLFTARELDYALSGSGLCAERLAARFAAKEAVIKALSLAESGINWRDIETVRQRDGSCVVVLHGMARRAAHDLGVSRILLSMSHEGDYAFAVVNVLLHDPLAEEQIDEHVG